VNPTGHKSRKIGPSERQRIDNWLRAFPIFEVVKLSGRPIGTLARIAEKMK
jgi:hypothetical protein